MKLVAESCCYSMSFCSTCDCVRKPELSEVITTKASDFIRCTSSSSFAQALQSLQRAHARRFIFFLFLNHSLKSTGTHFTFLQPEHTHTFWRLLPTMLTDLRLRVLVTDGVLLKETCLRSDPCTPSLQWKETSSSAPRNGGVQRATASGKETKSGI